MTSAALDAAAGAHVTNISAFVPLMANLFPHRPAVIVSHGADASGRACYVHYTLKQLDEASNAIARGLESIGVTRGVRAALMVKPGLDFFALTFALFKIGAVPVMIDPGIGTRGLGQCLREAQPAAFIGIPKAHVARLALGWARETVKIAVTVGPSPIRFGHRLRDIERAGGPYETARTSPEDTAAILFTSGSTGVPKGAVYTHGIFIAQVRLLREVYGIEPGERDLATFPLFALFGPALGMTAIIPDMDATRPAHADPRKIIGAIEDFGATNMFASPALIDRVGRYGEAHKVTLPSLRRVISAGAPARVDALERFASMLSPGVQIFTPYGATEALPVTSIGTDEILGETRPLTAEGKGVCVGVPVPGVELAVIAITDEPVEEWSDALRLARGEIGEFAVKGPVVTREYYHRRESTNLAKIPDCPSGTVWHRMGDVGYVDERGRAWFCGRKSQRVVTPAGTLFTIPCEAVFNAHPAVYRSALVGVERGDALEAVLCVELEKGTPAVRKPAIREELLSLGAVRPHTQGIRTILFHPSFPVDIRHNAKIFREKLAVWAKGELR